MEKPTKVQATRDGIEVGLVFFPTLNYWPPFEKALLLVLKDGSYCIGFLVSIHMTNQLQSLTFTRDFVDGGVIDSENEPVKWAELPGYVGNN